MMFKFQRAEGTDYLSKAAVAGALLKKHILYAVGGFFSVVFGTILIMSITDPTMRDDILLAICFLLPSLFLVYRGRVCSKRLDSANYYNTFLEGDIDGFVALEDLTKEGLDAGKVRTELELLFRKGFFKNCTLQLEGNKAGIVLPDKVQVEESRMIKVTCERCGAVNAVRLGGTGECAYCGSTLIGKE